ncbi:ABC-type glutathione transport system ATPase component [Bradyrhizobium sp. GM0.4]
MTAPPAVSVKNLRIALPKGAERPFAVDGISLDLRPGKIVCVVGESGSGKSMCAHALMGLLPDTVTVTSGEIQFEGRDLLKLDDECWRDLRGRRLAMIFQEPMTALNPLMRIGDQMAEMFEAHGLLTPRERRAKALSLAREVGLPDPERIVRAYPHQLSGGQRQRAMIAMALALEPAVLVADEPTTALDVTTQAQILKLIRNLQRNRNMAVMLPSPMISAWSPTSPTKSWCCAMARWSRKAPPRRSSTRRNTTTPRRCSPPCPRWTHPPAAPWTTRPRRSR